MIVGLRGNSFKNAFHTLSYRFAAIILDFYSRSKGKEIKKYGQGCIADTLTHVYCLIESLVSILRYKDITIIKSQYRIIIKNLLFFCANVYTKQRLTFCCTRYFHLKKRPCPCTIFAFPTSQNYELSAQGNLWLEILEF